MSKLLWSTVDEKELGFHTHPESWEKSHAFAFFEFFNLFSAMEMDQMGAWGGGVVNRTTVDV